MSMLLPRQCKANGMEQTAKHVARNSPTTPSLTTGIWNKPRTLQERTNTLDESVMQIPCRTCAPSLASGVPEFKITLVDSPNPLHVHSIPLETEDPLPSFATPAMRRHQRYSKAEQDLASKFKRCHSETPLVDLQIRTLNKAMAILSAHAQDSRERVEKLRNMLASRSTDPRACDQLQRERWMEEKRQIAADLDAKAILKELENLRKSEFVSAGDSLSQSTSSLTPERRRQLNLARFLQSPAAHPPVRVAKAPLVLTERTLRRRTINGVSSLRLRPVDITNATNRRAKWHIRTKSLERTKTNSGSANFKNFIQMRRQSSRAEVEPISDDISFLSSSSTYSESSSSSSKHLDSPGTPPSLTTGFAPQIMDFLDPCPEESPSDVEDETGIATIYRPPSPHPIINEEDIKVQIPDYALDLMSGLNLDFDPFSELSTTPPATPPTRNSMYSAISPDQKKLHRFPSLFSLSTQFMLSKESTTTVPNTPSGTDRTSFQSHPPLTPEAFPTEKTSGSPRFFSRPRGSRDPSASAISLPRFAAYNNYRNREKESLPAKLKKRFSSMLLGRS